MGLLNQMSVAVDQILRGQRGTIGTRVVADVVLGNPSGQPAGFDLSRANKAKIIGVAALVLAVTIAMTTVVAIRLVRPLRALTAAARQPPQEHARVAVTTKDETGYLAAAFNDLTARREELEAQRKVMVSDIAHELRTPLTNIRGWLEVTRDGLLDLDPNLIASPCTTRHCSCSTSSTICATSPQPTPAP